MKIKIVQTVYVDAEAWANEFGIKKTEVRDDVKAYFNNWLQGHVQDLNLDTIGLAEYRGADYGED